MKSAVGFDDNTGLDVLLKRKPCGFTERFSVFHQTFEIGGEIVALALDWQFTGIGLGEQEQAVGDVFQAGRPGVAPC